MPLRPRVLHVTERHRREDGGLYTAVQSMVDNAALCNVHPEVFFLTDAEEPGSSFGRHASTYSPFAKSWLWSSHLKLDITKAIERFQPDIIHVHGCWMAAQLMASKIAAVNRIPLVLTLHNFLDEFLMKKGGSAQYVKRASYWRLLGRRIAERARIVHAITQREADRLAEIGITGEIRVIPNCVPATTLNRVLKAPMRHPHRRVLFVGRIDRAKGIHNLIRAVSLSHKTDFKVDIMGPVSDPKYYSSLCKLVDSLALSSRIKFLGPIYGPEKETILANSWVTCLPSYCEAMGFSNLESALAGVPSITTHETGLLMWDKIGGILARPQASAIAQALDSAFSWTPEERMTRANSLQGYVKTEFGPQRVSEMWRSLYGRLL